MGLWIILCLMTAVAALIVVVPVIRARRTTALAGQREIAVYADQLAEVGRDLERGLIGETESQAARTEISRRILRADHQAKDGIGPTTTGRRIVVAAAMVLVVAAVSIGLYVRLGSPELPDQPLAERKATPIDKLSPEDLVARLDQQLAANPNDVRGWDIAGPVYMRMQRFADAVNAFQTAIRLGGINFAREAGLGEALTANSQGVVTSDARTAFESATKLEPNSPLPKMYLALALSQDGKLQDSAEAWKRVVAISPPYEPWGQTARKELAAVEAKIAAQSGTAPTDGEAAAPPAGPVATAEPQQSASAPTGRQTLPDGTQTMIEGMVAQLRDRLDTQGGTPEDWGKLIKSYMVLGRNDDAKAAYVKARAALAADPAAMTTLSSIVADLGLVK
jgi:cytochrome c-type biogenesis protein CcmH